MGISSLAIVETIYDGWEGEGKLGLISWWGPSLAQVCYDCRGTDACPLMLCQTEGIAKRETGRDNCRCC